MAAIITFPRMHALLPSRILDNVQKFVGRDWLAERVKNWLHDDSYRSLLIIGTPGVGKTMFLAQLAGMATSSLGIEEESAIVKVRQSVKASHFCLANTRNSSPRGFAENVAKQLSTTIPGFAEALTATLAPYVQITVNQSVGTGNATGVAIGQLDLGAIEDELSFDRAFVAPLKRICELGYDETILLLIDALDEAQNNGGKKLAYLLAQLADLSSKVRLLITSRNDPRTLKFFVDVPRIDLTVEKDLSVADIRQFNVEQLNAFVDIPVSTRDAFASKLATRSDGVFLYAALVLEDIKLRASSLTFDFDTVTLPNGLDGIYHNFLNRELGKDEMLWFSDFEPLLGLIAVSQADGLTATQINAISCRDVRVPLRISKQFLSGNLPEGPFRLFHNSFADFLLRDDRNVDYHIDGAKMHQQVMEYYWATYHERWSQCDDYGLSNYSKHLVEARRLDRLGDLLSQEWMVARVSRDSYSYSGLAADLTVVWEAAFEQALAQIGNNDEHFLGFATCYRTALIRSHVRSISGVFPPALVRRAVETGIWTISKSLNVAGNLTNAHDRVRMYLMLLGVARQRMSPVMLECTLRNTYRTATSILDDTDRAWALTELAPYLSGTERDDVIVSALNTACDLPSFGDRGRMLAVLSQLLPEPERMSLLDRALASVRAEPNKQYQCWPLIELIPHFKGDRRSKIIEEVLALLALPEPLSHKQLWDALHLIPHLDGDTQKRTLTKLVADVKLLPKIERDDHTTSITEYSRPWLLARLASMSEGEQGFLLANEALTEARCSTPAVRCSALTALLPKIVEMHRDEIANEALLAFYELEHSDDAGRILTPLAPYLHGSALSKALLEMRIPRKEWSCFQVLELLFEHSDLQKRAALLCDLVECAKSIVNKEHRCKALLTVSRHIGDDKNRLLNDAVMAARDVTDVLSQVDLMRLIARESTGTLKVQLLEEALGNARSAKLPDWRAAGIAAVCGEFAEGERRLLIEEVITAGKLVEVPTNLTMALLLLRHDVDDAASNALSEIALQKATERGDEKLLLEVVQFLPARFVGQTAEATLEVARAIRIPRRRVWCMTALAVHCPEGRRHELLQEALIHARAAQSPNVEAWIMSLLALLASPAAREEGIKRAAIKIKTIPDAEERARRFLDMAQGSTGELRDDLYIEASQSAHQITNELHRLSTLSLISGLTGDVSHRQNYRTALMDSLGSWFHSGESWRVLGALVRADPFFAKAWNQDLNATLANDVIEICRNWAWL